VFVKADVNYQNLKVIMIYQELIETPLKTDIIAVGHVNIISKDYIIVHVVEQD
jgi:hypothetical protein